jgi:DNA-binding LytR/AlgR family response regulator
VPIGSVLAIHGADDYSELETTDGRKHLHKKTLAQLEQMLPTSFMRVHRSHIVNLRYVKELSNAGSGRREVVLSNGSTVPVGRVYVTRLFEQTL